MGTVGYMSPEQVRGETVDQRSDIFSLGCVLYEMVTGSQTFKGDTAVETMNAILKEEPEDVSSTGVVLPSELAGTIRRCLEKRPQSRFQSASDLAYNLRTISSASAPTTSGPTPRTRDRIRPTVWILPLENRTGDASLDTLGVMAADMIVQRFAETAVAETVRLTGAARRSAESDTTGMGIPPKDALFRDARQIGAGLLLSGAYYLDGQSLRLQAVLTDPTSGDTIYAFKPVTDDREAASQMIDDLRERVVSAVAAHLDPNFDIRVSRPPSSLDAFRVFMRGFEFYGLDYPQAVTLFRRALEIDPDFHFARLFIVWAYRNPGQFAKAKEELADAEKHIHEFTPFESAMFRAHTAFLDLNRVGSHAAVRQMLEIAPHIPWVRFQTGDEAVSLNRPREGVELLTPIAKSFTSAHFGNAYWATFRLCVAHHMLGEYEEQLEWANLGLERFPDVGELYVHKARALAAMGRIETVNRVIEDCLRVRMRQGHPGRVMAVTAYELRAHGHKRESEEMAGRAMEWFESHPSEGDANVANRLHVLQLLFCRDRWRDAQQLALELAGAAPQNMRVIGSLGVVAAHLGDADEAWRISQELPRNDDPLWPASKSYWQAAIAAHLGQKDRAVSLLRDMYSQGAMHDVSYHRDMRLEPLWDHPPFQELIRPKG
jgi:tetratricopeptide (TPR) repeat protein